MNYPLLSKRGTSAPASPIRSLATLAQNARNRGLEVHQLNIGQPDLNSPKAMIDAINNFKEKQISYSPSDGYPKYLEQLSNYYSGLCPETKKILPQDIVVTTGGSEALLFAIAATCNPNDELLLVEPTYTNYLGIANMLNVKIKAFSTSPAQNYMIDVDKLLNHASSNTKAICLASPGNPTGTLLSKENIQKLVNGCVKKNIFLIMDEVYREFVYTEGDNPLAPSALNAQGGENIVIVIDSVSKRYSACGLRVGSLISRRAEIREAALRFGQARLSPPTIGQYASMAGMKNCSNYIKDAIKLYKNRRDLLVNLINNIGIKTHPPDGSFYLPLALPVKDANDFCSFLLSEFEHENQTLCLAPMNGFYHTPGLGSNEVRMAYVLEPPKLEKCVEILKIGLESYSAVTT